MIKDSSQDGLSVIITARNEMFLRRTVEEVLNKMRGNTEVIVVMDGGWADPPLDMHPKVTVIYNHESVGQRAAINQAARISRAKFIMKLDAHCALDEGFDVKLMANCEYDWTVVPRMYNLHAFDWVCKNCNKRTYQGPTPPKCEDCGHVDHYRDVLWIAKRSPETDHMRFDRDLKFQYWSEFKQRPEAQGDIADTMSILGACFFMHRDRYWELGGSDEEHGSWGQQGTEISCKTWLSGGRLVVNKKTWFAHMFRTQGGDFGFPYPLSGADVDKARKHSQDIWMNGKWPKAKHDLNWLIQKFAPVPGWDSKPSKKGIIYYTDNQLNVKIAHKCQKQLLKSGLPIVSVSLKPMNFGTNIHMKEKRGILTMFKQILKGLETSTAEFVFFCEHDVLYHPSHFDFTPPRKDAFYYNTNVWKFKWPDGPYVWTDDLEQVSGICVYRKLAIEHYKNKIKQMESGEFDRHYEPNPRIHYQSVYPNICIRHDNNLTKSKWSPEEFRNSKYAKGWKETKSVPGWEDDILKIRPI